MAANICWSYYCLLLLCFVLCVRGSLKDNMVSRDLDILNLKLPTITPEGSIVVVLGCAARYHDVHGLKQGGKESEFHTYFAITDDGNIITKSLLNHRRNITVTFQVTAVKTCFENISPRRMFIIDIVDDQGGIHFMNHVYSGHLYHDSCMVCKVQGMSEILLISNSGQTLKSSDESINKLHGPNSESFDIVPSNDVSEILLRIFSNDNIVDLNKGVYHFILEAWINQVPSGFTNIIIEVKSRNSFNLDSPLYFELEDSESELNSHDINKESGRTDSSKIVRNRSKRQSQSSGVSQSLTQTVPEDKTGVLFSIQNENDGWGQYTYRVTLSIPTDIFKVNQNGTVSLKEGEHLDYEEGPRQYQLHIERSSVGGGVTAKTIAITVNIINVNDENPVFINMPSPFLAVVRENDPTGTQVYHMSARDPDGSRTLEFRTAQLIGFIIDASTGVITTGRMFNQPSDDGRDFPLEVIVRDNEPPGNQEATATVTVRVGTRAPQFYADYYRVDVKENSDIGTRFEGHDQNGDAVFIKAINFQADLGGVVIYTLYSSNNITSDIFRVEEGGLITQTVLSLKQDEPFYNLTLRAQDNETGLSTDVQVTVHLIENYNPRFYLPVYTTTISESFPINQTILNVSAYNKDSATESSGMYFNYTILNSVDSGNFTIINSNGIGEIRLKRYLDYDTTYPYHSYTIEVAVTEKNGNPSLNITTKVVIYVTNENDFAPEFIHQSTSTIPDNLSPGSTVMNVRAIDKDGDKIKYHFQNEELQTEYFMIDQNTGSITLSQTLTTDSPNNFNLQIYAKDDGSCCPDATVKQHTRRQNISISIVDSTNGKPVFTDCTQYYSSHVQENQPRGTYVAQVSATDSNRGNNGDVTYSILSFRGPNKVNDFIINPITGNISSNVIFDREALLDIVKVTVIAEDHGKPPLRDECTFPITILDENDNSPKFLSSGASDNCDKIGYVLTNSTIGTVVINVGANDDDTGQNAEIEFSLTSNPGDLFAIDPEKGIISLNASLTDQNVGTVDLEVMAQDRGISPLNTTMRVSVMIRQPDEANEMPTQWLDNNPIISINDSTREADGIAYFNISGSNITAVGIILECEAKGPSWGHFRLIQKSLDNKYILLTAKTGMADAKRQQTIQLRSSKTILLNGQNKVIASDIYPRIELIDTNDRIPTFQNRLDPVSQQVQLSVTENQTFPISVGTLFAFDADLTVPFNTVTYEIRPPTTGFQIDTSTGEIKTTQVFDREGGFKEYQLSVFAVDGAPSSNPNMNINGQQQPNTGSVAVRITVEDVNDNPPFFQKSRYLFNVSEDQPVDFILGRITADDNDDDLTSQYTKYSLSSNSPGNSALFSVRETTGDIIVASVLSGKSNQVIELTFTADDGKFKADVPVSISITKVFERRPVFNAEYNIKNIVANRSYGEETLFQVHATDPDCQTGSCGIRYNLLTNDATTKALFHLDSINGNITLNGVLDPRQYSFSVEAIKTSSRQRRSVSISPASYAPVYINPALCNEHECPLASGECQCCDYCASNPCANGGTCGNVCSAGELYGYQCICPEGFEGRLCEIAVEPPTPGPYTEDENNNTWLIILLVCIAIVIIIVILVIAFLFMRRRNVKDKESIFGYDNDDYDIREDVMDYDEEGAGEDDFEGYDISVISKPSIREETVRQNFTRPDTAHDVRLRENHQQGSVPQANLHGFITDRLTEAEDDPYAPPYDTIREYDYEGSGSEAGSLSSIETTTSGGSQDYDYLNEWGPKFARLADMYNTYDSDGS